MAKSKPINWDAARWSTGVTDHVTRSDRHDWYYYTWEDDGNLWQPWGDDGSRWVTIVWLGSLEFRFVIKGAVVRLNWSLSFVIAKQEVVNK